MMNYKQITLLGLHYVWSKIKYSWGTIVKKLREPFEIISGKELPDTSTIPNDTLTELESKIGELDSDKPIKLI